MENSHLVSCGECGAETECQECQDAEGLHRTVAGQIRLFIQDSEKVAAPGPEAAEDWRKALQQIRLVADVLDPGEAA